MSRWTRYAMPADPAELEAMLNFAFRVGREKEARDRGGSPPVMLRVPCEEHDAAGPDRECMACIEANSYCPHGSLGLRHFFRAEPADPCWRPRLRDETEGP